MPTATPSLTPTPTLAPVLALNPVTGLKAGEITETEIILGWDPVEDAQFYEASIKKSKDGEDAWNTIRVRYPEVAFSGLEPGKQYDFKVCAGADNLFSREAFLLKTSTAGTATVTEHGRSEDLPKTTVTVNSKILLRPEPNEVGKNGPDNVGPKEVLKIYGLYKDSSSGTWYVRISQKAVQYTNNNSTAGSKFVQGYVPVKYTDLKNLSDTELKNIHEEAIAVGASENELLDDVYNGEKALPAVTKVVGRDINLKTGPGSEGGKSSSVVKAGTDVDVLELIMGDDDQYYIHVRAGITTNPDTDQEKTILTTGYILVKYTDLVDRIKN